MILNPRVHPIASARVDDREGLVAGAEDATFPNAETREMADAIPNSSFVVLDGVAHLAALENPSLVNSLVEDFLAS